MGKQASIVVIVAITIFATTAMIADSIPYIMDVIGEIALVACLLFGLAAIIYALHKSFIAVGNARLSNEENRLYLERMAIDNQRALLDLQIINPKGNVLPVARNLIASGEMAGNAVNLLEMNIDAGRTHPNVPGSLHYSNKSDGAQMDGEIAALGNHTVPNFGELVRDGALGSINVMLGYVDGQPLYAKPHKVKSIVCGGLSGSGKSNTTRFLLAQYAMLGWRLAIFDPHGNSEEGILSSLAPLSGSFFMPPAIEFEDGMEMLRCVMLEGERRARVEGSRPNDFDPLLFVIDEVAEFAAMATDEERQYAEKSLPIILKSFRKFNIFAFCISQFWSKSEMGDLGFKLRRAAQTSIIHRMPKDGAQVIESFGDFRAIDDLPTGVCLMNNTDIKRTRLQIPLCDQGHIEAVMPTAGPTSGPTSGPTAGPTSGPAVVPQIEDLQPPTMAVGPAVGPDVQPEHMIYIDAAQDLTPSQRIQVEISLRDGFSNGRIILEVFNHPNKTNDRKGRKFASMINGVRLEMGLPLPYSPARGKISNR